MIYLTNAFSLNMLGGIKRHADVSITPIHRVRVRARLKKKLATSIVGHADTADLFAKELGVPVPFNRQSVKLCHGDVLLVGQYNGPRLPEGCHTLPEGATITWLRVLVRFAEGLEAEKSKTLQEVGVNIRIVNILAKHGIVTVGDATARSAREISCISFMGPRMFQQLLGTFEDAGIPHPWESY